MSNVLVDQASLQDIADAIRSKLGIQDTYKPSEMADAIESISGGGITPTGTKQINVTQNGTVTEDVTSYASAQVNVNVPQPTGTMSITENGTYDVTNYAGADVNVAGGGGYDVDAGDLTALFDKYAEENDMLVMDLTIASDQTANWTVNHSLGRVPVEALLYPKNFSRTGGGYMIGWVTDGSWADDRLGNRTMYPTTNAIPQTAMDQVWYPIAKNFPSLLYSIKVTDYNFTQSAPTSTTVTLRGGTNVNTKLLAGEYRLALR